MSMPKWFRAIAAGAVEEWEYAGRYFTIHEVTHESPVGIKWVLDIAYLTGIGGEGHPFTSREAMDEYITRHKLRPAMQLTLGI